MSNLGRGGFGFPAPFINLSFGETMKTCDKGEHKRIEVTCLDCIDSLRAEVAMIHRKYTVLLGEKLEADDRAKAALLQIGELRPVVEATIEALAAGAALTASCKAVDWEAEKPDTVKFDAESVVHDAAWAKLEAAVAVYKGRASEKPNGEIGERGNCSECGALVERLYSLRCPACYDKLAAGMEKRVDEPRQVAHCRKCKHSTFVMLDECDTCKREGQIQKENGR